MDKHNLSTEKIIAALQSQQSTPSSAWVESTKRRLAVLADSKAQTNSQQFNLFIKLTHMSKQRLQLLGAVSFTFVVLAVGGFLLIRSRLNTTRSIALSATEQQQVFAQILRNNSTSTITNSQTIGQENAPVADKLAATNTGTGATLVAPSPFPFINGDYNYYHSVTSTTTGSGASKCVALGYNANQTSPLTFESYSYSDKQGNSLYKYQQTDGAGNLLSYSLGKNSSTHNEYYDYRGGKFAVKFTYDITPIATPEPNVEPGNPGEPTSPMPTEPSPDDIKNYFGEDAKVTAIVTENGVEYYQVEYSFLINCSSPILYMSKVASAVAASEQATAQENRIYTVSLFRKSDLQLHKTSTYLDAIADANLIDSSTYTQEAQNVEMSAVSGNFNFEYNVTVRTFSGSELNPSAAEMANKTADYLAKQNWTLLIPTVPAVSNVSIGAYDPTPSSNPASSYYLERDFYPAGAFGDKLFDEATKSYSDPNAILSLAGIYAYSPDSAVSVNIETYSKEHTIAQMLQSRYGTDYNQKGQSAISIKINGGSVQGTLYEISMPLMTFAADAAIEPGFAPCTGEECTYTEKVIVVEYAGQVFFIMADEKSVATQLEFSALNTANTTDMAKIRELLLKQAEIDSQPVAVSSESVVNGSDSSAPLR